MISGGNGGECAEKRKPLLKTVEKYVLFGPAEGSSQNKSKTEKRTYLVRNIKKEKDEKHGNEMVTRRWI